MAQPVKGAFTFSEKTLTMMLMLGLVHWLTEYSANQNTVQRFCAARSTEDAERSLWVCAAASLPIWAFYMFLGTALWVFFDHINDPFAQAVLSGEAKAEQILPYFITEYLPVGLVGLVLAAALAAAMSSLDSSINAIATVTTVDLYQTTASGAASSDAQRLRLAKRVTLAASVVMILGAGLFQSATMKTLQDSMTAIVSILSGGLFGLYCLAFFTRVRSALAVWLAIAVTLAFSVWALFLSKGWIETEHLVFDLYYTAIAANITLFVTGLIVGHLLLKVRQA